MESILNVEVSRFANYETPENPETINLVDWLMSDAYRAEIEQLRQITDKAMRDKIKATLPAITPSAVCSYREQTAVLQHSGLIQFDIDFKDNKHITNYQELKQQISKIKNVAYCGLSASGTGFWGLIKIAYPERHKQHFTTVKNTFLSLGITLDNAPKNKVSLRGYSYDRDAYFNHNAIPLQRYEVQTPPPKTTYTANPTDDQAKVETCLSEIEARKIDLTYGYNEWFSIGCSFAGTFGEQGREYYHRVSQFHPDYTPTKTDIQFNHCLKVGSGSIGAFLNRCASVDIRYKQADYTPAPKPVASKTTYPNQPQTLAKLSFPEPLPTVENLIKPEINVRPPVENLTISDNFSKEPLLEPALTKEFYHYTYNELTALLGEPKALQRVRQYQNLSEQYTACKSFVVHTCQLLTSYQQHP